MTKNVLMIARVSTEEQNKHGQGTDVQIDDNKRYCAYYGFVVKPEHILEDDHSATTMRFFETPLGKKARQIVKSGEVQVVVIWRLDRLTRYSVGDGQDTVDEWLELGLEVHSVKDIGGPITDTNDISFIIHNWKSVDEAKVIRLRTMGGRRRAIVEDKRPVANGGMARFGYRFVGKKNETRLEIVESEAETMRLIFNWFAWGNEEGLIMGIQAIANELTRLGIPSAAEARQDGRNKKRQYHGKWTSGLIYPLLKDEIYAGVWHGYKYKVTKYKDPATGDLKARRSLRPRSEWQAVSVPAIIDRETWERVQEKLEEGRHKARPERGKHPFLMAGRLTCQCGYHWQGKPCWTNKKEKRSLRLYYRCNRKHRPIISGKCDMPGLRASVWDDKAWEWVKDFIMRPAKMLKSMRAEQAQRRRKNESTHERLTRVEKKLEELYSQSRELLEAELSKKYKQKVIDMQRTILDGQIADREKEVDDLRAEVSEVEITDEQIETFEQFANVMRQGIGNVTFQDKRDFFEWVEFKGKVTRDDEGEVGIDAECIIGRKRLSLVPGHS